MMRSFVSLADTLNLSKSVRALNTTRQTLRRHIATLEDHKGGALFQIEDQQYRLTDLGERSLREAEQLISRADAWLANQSGHVGGLLHLARDLGDGAPYYLQQHHLDRLWTSSSPLLQRGLQIWAEAKGEIESDAYAAMRPYLMVFREHAGEWICVDVGANSSYATWYGWRWEKSAIGRSVEKLPGGVGFANLLKVPFDDIHATGGVRLDHIHTMIRRSGDDEMLAPISYQRLLTGCKFPDGSFALAALIDRTWNIDIEGLPQAMAKSMSKDLIMKVDAP
ncbi:LysR family transcriptional regulator [Aliiroseovarius sp. N1Y82]|nr:LysR family transcriptional regulator [Aliiroseovarius subalbicans]MCI2398922.1 LysR family transcriptional regulator [Aliiroseovarius subalbicans]